MDPTRVDSLAGAAGAPPQEVVSRPSPDPPAPEREVPHGAAPPPQPTPRTLASLLAGKPGLRGFLWATGTISFMGLLLFGVAPGAKPRARGDSTTARTTVTATPVKEAVGADETAAKAALAHNPDDLEARLALARAYLDREDFMAVWTETQHVLARSPGEPRALTYQSQVRLAMGQPDVAQSMLKKALATDPNLLQAYVYLSFVHLQMGQAPEAEAAIAEATRRFPDQTAMLRQGFARMKDAAAKQGPITPTGEANPHASVPPPGAGPAHPPTGANPHRRTDRGVSGVLELDSALKGRIEPGSVAFITVRDATFAAGPPIAAKRLAAISFPLSFEITDADSMMELPIPEQILLEARIDADGDPMTRDPEEPSARLGDVKIGSTGLRLVLKRR